MEFIKRTIICSKMSDLTISIGTFLYVLEKERLTDGQCAQMEVEINVSKKKSTILSRSDFFKKVHAGYDLPQMGGHWAIYCLSIQISLRILQ